MKKKSTFILIGILLLLVFLIVFYSFSINEKKQFVEPQFESNYKDGIPDVERFEERLLKVDEGYTFYVNPSPIFHNDSLLVNFTSVNSNKVLLKLRVFDSQKNLIGETGVLKAGQFLDYVKLDNSIKDGDEITFVVMGYEKDSYLSAGSVSVKVKVGEKN